MKLVANVIFLSFTLLDISWDEWCNYIHRSVEMKISIRMLINCFKTRLPTWRRVSFIRWTLPNLICCLVKLDLSLSFWLQNVDIYPNWWDVFYFFFLLFLHKRQKSKISPKLSFSYLGGSFMLSVLKIFMGMSLALLLLFILRLAISREEFLLLKNLW